MSQDKIVRHTGAEGDFISHLEFADGMGLLDIDNALPRIHIDYERSDGEYVTVSLTMVTRNEDIESIELEQRIPMGELLEGQLFDLCSFWQRRRSLYQPYEDALEGLLNQQGVLRFYKEADILRVRFSFGNRHCIGTLTWPQAMKCLSGAYVAAS